MDNIGPVSPTPPSPDFSSPENLLQEFDTDYTNFINHASKTTAQTFLHFLQHHSQALSQLAIYPPFYGADWSNCFQGAIRGLKGYIAGKVGPDPAYEFTGDLRVFLGINVTPQEILAAFKQAMEVFEKNPNRSSADAVLNFLDPKFPAYVEALSQFETNPGFKQDCAVAYDVINAFREDSSNPNKLNAAEDEVKILISDLPS